MPKHYNIKYFRTFPKDLHIIILLYGKNFLSLHNNIRQQYSASPLAEGPHILELGVRAGWSR